MKKVISLVFSLFLFCALAPMAAADEAPAALESVNINSADVETLVTLSGIGPARAEAIIAWREANGDFVSVDQLVEVRGIGESTVEANREVLSVE
ncbi:ComEA family DNA-binding protein [Marinimicrobium sp. ABcell2]|uniref:ComEA family DNA-binding protein n=1 Tax=Marinimicrobium sp. ABcell2 TaxID=3069751 RepID=UPI0027B79E80|nr:ComEA family DNA-binding protein [Marinimicrobium sp. ABcell2]MDQ2078057.1 ComEA family DNA-binding protein [Marinimicrobium sp. ABcell2]